MKAHASNQFKKNHQNIKLQDYHNPPNVFMIVIDGQLVCGPVRCSVHRRDSEYIRVDDRAL